MTGTPRTDAVKASLVRNLTIVERLGCLDVAGMAKLKTGNAPTVTLGPYADDIASGDHIIPRSVCEELDERLYNLEFMPSKMNGSKGNKIGLPCSFLDHPAYGFALPRARYTPDSSLSIVSHATASPRIFSRVFGSSRSGSPFKEWLAVLAVAKPSNLPVFIHCFDPTRVGSLAVRGGDVYKDCANMLGNFRC